MKVTYANGIYLAIQASLLLYREAAENQCSYVATRDGIKEVSFTYKNKIIELKELPKFGIALGFDADENTFYFSRII